MTGPKVTSTDGSTVVGGDNTAPVVNVKAGDASIVNVQIEHQRARELPSFLGAVIVLFSQQSLSEYGRGTRRPLPAEVMEKVNYNNFPQDHRVLTDYYRHSLVLERAYHGVEQQNADARYLVRRRAGVTYESQLAAACERASIPTTQKTAFARANAALLVDAVIEQLLQDYASSIAIKVEQETAHLAVSLIVADAVVECEVLERPPNASAA
jgi:hypothetical protein